MVFFFSLDSFMLFTLLLDLRGRLAKEMRSDKEREGGARETPGNQQIHIECQRVVSHPGPKARRKQVSKQTKTASMTISHKGEDSASPTPTHKHTATDTYWLRHTKRNCTKTHICQNKLHTSKCVSGEKVCLLRRHPFLFRLTQTHDL